MLALRDRRLLLQAALFFDTRTRGAALPVHRLLLVCASESRPLVFSRSFSKGIVTLKNHQDQRSARLVSGARLSWLQKTRIAGV